MNEYSHQLKRKKKQRHRTNHHPMQIIKWARWAGLEIIIRIIIIIIIIIIIRIIMINRVMINEEKVDKRSPLPPSLAHFTPLKVNYFDTRLWRKRRLGDLSGSTTGAVLSCRGSGCHSPPTYDPAPVSLAGSATRSVARSLCDGDTPSSI